MAEGVTSVHRSGEIASMAPKGRTELEVGVVGAAIITVFNLPVNSLSIDGMMRRPLRLAPILFP